MVYLANINGYLDSIPAESIARAEIVAGAVYFSGSEASTGLINIITKKKMPNTLSLTKGEYGREKAALTLNADKLNFAVALEQSDPMKGYSSNYKQINDLNKKSFTASYKFDDNWSFHISTMTASIPMINMTKPGASLPRMRITTILMIFHACNIRMTA